MVCLFCLFCFVATLSHGAEKDAYKEKIIQCTGECPQFFYGMVVIGSLSMVGDGAGGGCGGIGRALGGRWEGVGTVLGGRWEVVRVGAGSLIYRQIKSLHCSGYLLVSVLKSTQGISFLQPTI